MDPRDSLLVKLILALRLPDPRHAVSTIEFMAGLTPGEREAIDWACAEADRQALPIWAPERLPW